MQKTRNTLAVSVAITLLLVSSMAASVVVAHPEDEPVDGNASNTKDGLVEVPPFANSTIDGEWYATHFRVRADGSASVTVLVSYYKMGLEKDQYPYGDEESEEYRLFEEEVVAAMETLAEDASKKTGREMSVSLDRTNHGFGKKTGRTLQFELTWTNFAEVYENGTYVVTEPFTSGHPLLMQGHDSRIHWVYSTVSWAPVTNDPEPYEVSLQGATGEVTQEFESVEFHGMEDGHEMSGARVVYSPASTPTPTETATATATLTASSTSSLTPVSEPASSGFPLWTLGLLFVVLVLVGELWRRQPQH